jgi:AraC-like DNA-binding protein
MKFDKYIPADELKPYIKFLIISESNVENTYKVFPSTGLVLGFQYKGGLTNIDANNIETALSPSGITGIADKYKTFRNVAGTGTVLVYFSEVGFAFFSRSPANELFNQSVALDNFFDKHKITEAEERLAAAKDDAQRVRIVERFLLTQLKQVEKDRLIIEAVKIIYESKGNIRISELNKKLCISQSPFEKRFHKLVGASPKKFASIVRFNAVVDNINKTKSLTELCYENNFFDQAHFIKDFKKYTGDTPENFKRFP